MAEQSNGFLEALDALESERGISRETVFDALKEALEKSYKRNYLCPEANVRVEIDPDTFAISLYEIREVVDDVNDEDLEVSLEEAQAVNPDYKIGDQVETKVDPQVFGRLAASQTKQILRQKIREAEKEVLYNEYIDKKDEIITGTVDSKLQFGWIINIGKMGAILPASRMIPNEKLVPGQPIKVYVTDVENNAKGARVSVSRTDPQLVKRLFELEVPEIYDGTVEIKNVSREPGQRCKIAVYAKNKMVDPIGACVGPKGTRVRNIVNELNGEMVDIVLYDKDPKVFIANALSPAQVKRVLLHKEDDVKTATVIVNDNQLSLAIGKSGQNARLAVRLTEWKIDIKSQSEADAEGLDYAALDDYRMEVKKPEPVVEEVEPVVEMVAEPETVEEIPAVEEPVVEEAVPEVPEEEPEPEPVVIPDIIPDIIPVMPQPKKKKKENRSAPRRDYVRPAAPTPKKNIEAMPIFTEDEDYDYEYDDDDDLAKYDEDIDYDAYDEYYDN